MTARASSQNKVTSLLRMMFKLQHNVDELLTSQVGLGLSAFRILSVLDKAKALNQRHIAGMLGQTEANVSRQIRHMADHGLVKIAPDKKDRRQRNVTTSAKGTRKLAEAEKLLKRHQATILKTAKL